MICLGTSRARERAKNVTLIEHSSGPISAQEIAQLLEKQFGEVIIFLVDDPVLYAALALKTLGCLRVTKSEKTLAFDLKNN